MVLASPVAQGASALHSSSSIGPAASNTVTAAGSTGWRHSLTTLTKASTCISHGATANMMSSVDPVHTLTMELRSDLAGNATRRVLFIFSFTTRGSSSASLEEKVDASPADRAPGALLSSESGDGRSREVLTGEEGGSNGQTERREKKVLHHGDGERVGCQLYFIGKNVTAARCRRRRVGRSPA